MTKLQTKRKLFKLIYGALIGNEFDALTNKELYDTINYCRNRFKEQYGVKEEGEK